MKEIPSHKRSPSLYQRFAIGILALGLGGGGTYLCTRPAEKSEKAISALNIKTAPKKNPISATNAFTKRRIQKLGLLLQDIALAPFEAKNQAETLLTPAVKVLKNILIRFAESGDLDEYFNAKLYWPYVTERDALQFIAEHHPAVLKKILRNCIAIENHSGDRPPCTVAILETGEDHQQLLLDIFEQSNNSYSRYHAIGKITDQNYIRAYTQYQAQRTLGGQDDDDLKVDIQAARHGLLANRDRLTGKDDQEWLKNIIGSTQHPMLKAAAVESLTDVDLLNQYAYQSQTDCDYDAHPFNSPEHRRAYENNALRNAAQEQLHHLGLLAE